MLRATPDRAPVGRYDSYMQLLVLVGAGALGGGIAVLSCLRRPVHFEWFAIAAQFLLLLPALVFALRPPVLGERAWPRSGGVPRWLTAACLAGFLTAALVAGSRVSPGVLIPDESAYGFQARILASGSLVAQPPPGATDVPTGAPVPLRFVHHLVSTRGWYAKYPIGWPLVLAAAEPYGLGWVVAPLVALVLLLLVRAIAREAFGGTGFAAMWLAMLSPLFLAGAVGRMPHALAGALTAAACLFCLRGVRTRRLSDFALMFAPLVLLFHVRPFTGLIMSVVLGCAALIAVRRERGLAWRVAAVGVAAAVLAGVSVAAYNRELTGSVWLSPYAWYRNLPVPAEISASPASIAGGAMLQKLRMSAQSTLAWSFPLAFVLAAWGCWLRRALTATRILAVVYPALVLGHLVQPEWSAWVIGERYWFEGYFAVAILAAQGMASLDARWQPSVRLRLTVAVLLTAWGAGTCVAAVNYLEFVSRHRRIVAEAVERFRDRPCVVFLADTPPVFYGEHLNLNDGDWRSAPAVVLRDPGAQDRPLWAGLFGRDEWVVITYDPGRQRAASVTCRRGAGPSGS